MGLRSLQEMATEDRYRLIARFYDRLIEPMQAGVRRKAMELVPPQPGWRVLDVGCGTGTGLVPYADAGCAVVGVDVSKAMLERAANRLEGRGELHLTDGGTLPVGGAETDLVITSMVLHEVPPESRTSFLAEIARAAKPDGRVLVIDFRSGKVRGLKGYLSRSVSWVIELFSGHFSEYRSFMRSGGFPALVRQIGLTVELEKPVAGGNVAIYVARPA